MTQSYVDSLNSTGASGSPNPGPRVVILVPAHNEEQGIAATVQSLFAQTRRPDRVLVAADNCNDRTVQIAKAYGAEVMETVDNRAKKAGALNQALANRFRRDAERRDGDRRPASCPYPGADQRAADRRSGDRRSARSTGPDLRDDDFVLAMDADSQLAPDFVAQSLGTFERESNLGGLSGVLVPRDQRNLLERLQAIEYSRGTRQVARKEGQVNVLSGAASVFPAGTLRQVAASRGSELPGRRGEVFLEGSLTEDYELTLAIRKLGYRCVSTRHCRVVTDLMSTVHELGLQRLRWIRGAIESLSLYGWSRLTRRIWLSVAANYLGSLVMLLVAIALAFSFVALGVTPDPRWWAVMPLFVAEQAVAARRVGGKARWLPLLYFPIWAYEVLLYSFAWRALFRLVRRSDRVWVT